MVQKPYDNDSKTAFCLKGVEGCGKDTIFNWFGNNILGSEYYLNENKMDLILVDLIVVLKIKYKLF